MSQPYFVRIGGGPASTWSVRLRCKSSECDSMPSYQGIQKSLDHISSGELKNATPIREGGLSVFAVTRAAIFPFIRSGKSDIAFALNGVTRCFSSIVLKSLVRATPTLIPSGSKGYRERAV